MPICCVQLNLGIEYLALVPRDVPQLEYLSRAHHIEDLVEGDLLKHLVSLLILIEAHAIVVNHAEQVLIHVRGQKGVLVISLAQARASLAHRIVVHITLGLDVAAKLP